MKVSSAVRFLAAAFSASACVDAWPNWAGTCDVGPDGPVFGIGVPHEGFGQGDLEGSYVTDINLEPLVVSEPFLLSAGVEHTMRVLSARGDGFKGLLVTLSADGKDLSESLGQVFRNVTRILASDADGPTVGNPSTPPVCAATVAGATHSGPIEFDLHNVPFTINIASANIGAVNLTVTVMESTQTWYHSVYELNVVDAPTAAPSVSMMPTNMPTVKPTSAPATPTVAPTAAPSASPTVTPSGAVAITGGGASTALLAVAGALGWIFS